MRVAFTLSFALSLWLSASCGPPWTVVRQSGPPSALEDVAEVSVAVDFSQLRLGDEALAQYLESKEPEEQEAFQEVLRSTEEGFRNELAERLSVGTSAAEGEPEASEARVTARFVEMEQGKYAFAFKLPSELRTRLVWSVGGEVVDEIEVFVRVEANRQRPAIIQRLRIAGIITARQAATFFDRARGS